MRFKVVCVGDGSVGKTCMLMTYLKNEFPVNYIPTIVENFTTDIEVNSVTYTLSIWDTAGQEELDKIRDCTYPGTDVVLLCYSIINITSFKNITEKWVPEIRGKLPQVPIIIVGLKTDLRNDLQTLENLRQLNQEPITALQGDQIAKETKSYCYVECSAKKRENLSEIFEQAVNSVKAQKNSKKKKCLIL
ncbi:gtpase crac1b [Anaeramoeba ignava]|uniref:Gtpase crac1b n=1 Tax=Anaeramoeba ignava TaxID=1746090 RepID=A0A9Q0LX97_ANAIG|nr:gtpase crac1b [Anaeramoeba ignava]